MGCESCSHRTCIQGFDKACRTCCTMELSATRTFRTTEPAIRNMSTTFPHGSRTFRAHTESLKFAVSITVSKTTIRLVKIWQLQQKPCQSSNRTFAKVAAVHCNGLLVHDVSPHTYGHNGNADAIPTHLRATLRKAVRQGSHANQIGVYKLL
jgi:hypothetical protein